MDNIILGLSETEQESAVVLSSVEATSSQAVTQHWYAHPYGRQLLDQREKWGVTFSISLVLGVTYFLLSRSHPLSVDFIPLIIGTWGSLFVYCVNHYHSDARSRSVGAKKKIGPLGWMHITTPLFIAALATAVLLTSNPDRSWFGAIPLPRSGLNP